MEKGQRLCYACDQPFTPKGNEGVCSDCGRTIITPFIKKARKLRGHHIRKNSSRG